jgi:hypothetical protein
MPDILRANATDLPIYDFSADFAHLQCLILTLMDFSPDGEWRRLPIYQKWVDRASKNTVTYAEFCQLTNHLEKAIAALKFLPDAP